MNGRLIARRLVALAISAVLLPVGGQPAIAEPERDFGRPAPTASEEPVEPAAAPHAAALDVTEPVAEGQHFTGVTPYRVLDTRDGVGAPKAPLGQGQALALQVGGTGGPSGVPATADAVAVNVTATGPTSVTYVSVWPAGGERPFVSSLNLVAGQTRANLVQVALSPDGRIELYNNLGSVELVVDVVGFYERGTGDGTGLFKGRSPERVFDSRSNGAGPLGAATRTVEVPVVGVAGVPADADSVILNVTVTEPTATSFVTVWPTGQSRPLASSLNVVAGETVPNRVIAKVGDDGSVSIYNNAGSAHVVVDIGGWFTGETAVDDGSLLRTVSPARVADTRIGLGVDAGPVGTQQSLRIPVAGMAGLPTADSSTPASAVVANITVVSPTSVSYLTAWPAGNARPLASDLNYVPGQTVANHAVVAVGEDGAFEVYNNGGAVQVVVDVLGYYSGEIKLADAVVVLSSQEREAVTVESPDTLRLAGGEADLSRVEVGSVVVSGITESAPNGFLRRVVEVQPQGPDRIARTEPATLSEVIAQGTAQLEIPLEELAAQTGAVTTQSIAQVQTPLAPESLSAAAAASWSKTLPFDTKLTVQPDDPQDVSAGAGLKGAVAVDAAASMALDVGIIKGFNFDFEARAGAAMKAELSASTALTILSAERQLREVQFKQVLFMVGPVPVVLQPEFELNYKAAMEVGGQFNSTMEKSQTAVGGFQVRNSSYEDYTDGYGTPLTFDVTSPTVVVQGFVELIPSLEVELYEAGEFGVGIAMGPQAVYDVGKCSVNLVFKAEVVVDFEVEILGREFGDGVEARAVVFEQIVKGWQADDCQADAWTITGVTADRAARELLGSGVSLQTASYTGAASAMGTYTAPFEALPISRGLILSSGDAEALAGPNEVTDFTATHSLAGDDELSQLTGAPSYDAASLSMTVVPSSPTLQIDFGFASEEYMEFVDQGYNDAFAIYVNGKNCAIIDTTFEQVPVTVDAINSFRNQLSYVDNADGGKETQADGLTTLLRCNAPVTPGMATQVRMVIADVGDSAYDSWAYIQRGGMRSVA